MSIDIIHRYTKAVLFRAETAESIRDAVVVAVGSGAYLRGANLRGAYLRGAYLRDQLMPDAPTVAELRASVASHIEAHPELHDQETWGDGTANPSCDTPCCVAGWACHLGGGDRGLGVQTAATLLLWSKDLPMPDFSAGTSREDILAALRATA